MRERPASEEPTEGRVPIAGQDPADGAGPVANESDGSVPAADASDVVQMAPHITATEALAVFRRKLPGANAEVTPVVHPFWWVQMKTETKGLLSRRRPAEDRKAVTSQRMNILVNAESGKGYIADFEPCGHSCKRADWNKAGGTGNEAAGAEAPRQRVTASAAGRTGHALARTKIVKTVKLGMRIAIADLGAPRRVLKPNWLVTGANKKYSATMLVDGLDSSHYLVRVERIG